MIIAAMTFRLHAPWVHSLKEKRMVVKSLIAQLQNKFHVSASEIDKQDTHQIIVIGVAVIVPNNSLADSLMDEIAQCVETATDAQVLADARQSICRFTLTPPPPPSRGSRRTLPGNTASRPRCSVTATMC